MGPGYGRRGRYRGMRWVSHVPQVTHFRPFSADSRLPNTVTISVEEIEVLRLMDIENLTQEEAAIQMGVSRKSLWNDLKSARKKVAEALVNGWEIIIDGGNYAVRPPVMRNKEPQPVINKPPLANEREIEEKAMKIFQLLPKVNCGLCGYGTCINFARAVASGDAPPDGCKIAGNRIKDDVKRILSKKEEI